MTLLVKGVRVLGATGEYPELMDVFVNGDKIAAIGNFPNKKADVTVDGQGGYLAPGFIDPNSETDHYLELFNHPIQDDFLRQGVTTMICGQEGSSLAPLLYGTLESLEEWANPERTNVNWHTMKEFLSVMGGRKLGVNFGTLVGHSTVRRALIGEHLRDLTRNELAVFARVLEESLASGAFGLSANLKSVYGRKTPYPELKSLLALVKKYHGVFSVGIRKATGLVEAVDEVVRIARETGATTIISNLLPVEGQRDAYELALEKIEGVSGTCDVWFDISPFERSVRPLYRFLPDWAQNGSLDEMAKQLHDEWLRPRLLKDTPAIDPDAFTILKARRNETLVGYTLRNLMELYDIKKPVDALYKLMQTTELHGLVGYRNVDAHMLSRAFSHPRSLIASKGVSLDRKLSRERVHVGDETTRAYPEFIRRTIEGNFLPLETAIRKITKTPADIFGLTGRGTIAEGMTADLVGLIASGASPRIAFTIVGGQLAFSRDEVRAAAGHPLRHRA